MKQLLLASTCLVLSSVTSMAADLPMQTKAPVYATPAFNWSGFYIGAQVGGGTMSTDVTQGTTNSVGKGAIAGGQIGYNYQDGNWVFGIEGEGYWSNIKLNQNFSEANDLGVVTGTFGNSIENRSDYTIAGRVGMAFDRTLIYGKGGWAWGAFRSSSFNNDLTPPPFSQSFYGSGTLDGFLVGVGVEHALTRNWTVKFEYNYIGYGAKEQSFTSCSTSTPCHFAESQPVSASKQLFKFGLNYLFDISGH
jgi:outer membrane immunogenic protein